MMCEFAKLLRRLVGARGFEPRASCAQGSCKKSILLVRLALFYVMVHGFGPDLAVVGPKLDPSFSLRSGRRQADAGYARLAFMSATRTKPLSAPSAILCASKRCLPRRRNICP